MLRIKVWCWLAATVFGHDVYKGSTTLYCPCETSGTVMLKPGDTLTVHNNAIASPFDATLGTIATKSGVDPLTTGDLDLAQFKAARVACELEMFSAVWHCPTHKNIPLQANSTYTFTVPHDAPQVASYFAWGSEESVGLRSGYRVPYDAALARDVAGFGLSATSALIMGNALIIVAMLAASAYYGLSVFQKQRLVTKSTAWINVVTLVSHAYCATVPLLWACSTKHDVGTDRTFVVIFAACDLGSVVYVLYLLCREMDGDANAVENSSRRHTSRNQYGANIILIAALYGALGFALPGKYWYVLSVVFAAFLLYVCCKVTQNTSLNELARLQPLRCAFLGFVSLVCIFLAGTQRAYFVLSCFKWFLLALCLWTLFLVNCADPVDVVAGGLMLVIAYFMLLFDAGSYALASFCLMYAAILYTTLPRV